MPLQLDAPHANEEEKARGVSAAWDVFHRHKRVPEYCQNQEALKSEGEDFDYAALQTWHDAETAAILECCKGWHQIPDNGYLIFE